MELNTVVIVALAIVAILGIMGLKRGLIKAVWHLVSIFVILGITIIASPYVARFAKSNEKIYNYFYNVVEKKVDIPATSGDNIDKFIDSLSLPERVTRFINEKAVDFYGKAENAQENFAQSVYTKLTDVILTSLSFILTFLIVTILCYLIIGAINEASKMPVLNAANKLGGLAIGLVEGIAIVWIICGVVPLISSSKLGQYIIECIYTNKFLTFFYENNILGELMSGRIFDIVSKTAQNIIKK